MDWLEFNIHINNVPTSINDFINDVTMILLNFVDPFINNQKSKFIHWHYLLEPDVCRGRPFSEIRLRFQGERKNLDEILGELLRVLADFSDKTHLTMRSDEPLGSHEGCHGDRNGHYMGAQSETFGQDWPIIVETLQKGSEFALEFFRLGRKLVENRSLKYGTWRQPQHPYYIHLFANQLLVEP